MGTRLRMATARSSATNLLANNDVEDSTPQGSMAVEENEPLIFSNLDDPSLRESTEMRPLPVWRKLAYAVGAMPYSMCNTVVGFYLSIFLLEVVNIKPFYVVIIVFSGRVWDAITDPTVGYLTSKTKTRFGRLRPWMMMAALPVGVTYTLLWFVPSGLDDKFKFAYYICVYFAFQALLSCIHVPYTALTMHLSRNYKERDSATLYRMCFEVLGTILGVLIYTAFFIGLVGGKEQICDDEGKREPDNAERRAYRYHALTLGVLTFFFVLTTFLGVREQKEEMRTDKSIGFLRGLKDTLTFLPYTYLLMIELFSWLAVQFIQGNFALYVKYTVGLEKQYPYVIAVLLVATILCMPFWQLIIVKFGKKTAFFAGMFTLMPTVLCLLYVDFMPYLIYPLSVIGGVGVSAAYLLPWSMLPDVVDEAALAKNVRREELFYAFFVFGNKFASGITLGISTGIYQLAGYDEDKCDQEWTVALTLKLLVTVPPIFFVLISLIFLHYYPITEKTRERTKKLLQERRSSHSNTTDGSPYVQRRRSISIPQWYKDTQKQTGNKQTGL